MKSGLVCSVLALLALTQLAAAQGPSGGTGAIASIPGEIVRGAEQRPPVTQPGIFSLLVSGTRPNPQADSRQPATPRGETRIPPK
jgi:hypothetical protein